MQRVSVENTLRVLQWMLDERLKNRGELVQMRSAGFKFPRARQKTIAIFENKIKGHLFGESLKWA